MTLPYLYLTALLPHLRRQPALTPRMRNAAVGVLWRYRRISSSARARSYESRLV